MIEVGVSRGECADDLVVEVVLLYLMKTTIAASQELALPWPTLSRALEPEIVNTDQRTELAAVDRS